jgi:hypothetical protein
VHMQLGGDEYKRKWILNQCSCDLGSNSWGDDVDVVIPIVRVRSCFSSLRAKDVSGLF